MKRILLGLLFAGCLMHAHAVTLADYCINTTSGICTWCSANEEANAQQGGYCNGEYVGCVRGERVVGSGGTVTDNQITFECTTSGFCYTSCPNTTRWAEFHGGIQRKETLGGCKCDTYQANCSTPPCYRCADGFYGTADNFGNAGCEQCPGVENANGEMVYGTSTAGNGTTIEGCLLSTTDELSDDTGRYVLTSDCEYKI